MSGAQDLTPQQLAFCEAYVANGRNGTQAAISAGYAASSAHVRASKLLAMPKIQRVIAELVIPAAAKAMEAVDKKEAALAAQEQDLAAREEIVAAQETLEQLRERVRGKLINRLVDMGFSVAGDVASWTEQGVEFIPSAELTPEAMASVASVEAKISEGESEDGKQLFRNVNLKIKQHDPYKAMKELARLLELGPKAAPTGKAESTGGVIIVVAGGPTGLELGARMSQGGALPTALPGTPIAVLAAPNVQPAAAESLPTSTTPARHQAAGELRPWNPKPRKKKLVAGVTAPRVHVSAPRPGKS